MKQVFKLVLKFLKVLIMISLIIFFLFIVMPTTSYYFSKSWLEKEQIRTFEKRAYEGDCDSAMDLFRHYKNIFYRNDLAGKWFRFSMRCNGEGAANPKIPED